MFPYNEENTSTETLQQLDLILDDCIKEVEANSVDLDMFKKVYTNEYSSIKNIIKIEEIKVETEWKNLELFMTAHDIKAMATIPGNKRRSGVRLKFIWYALATSKNITINAIDRLFAEIKDIRFKRNNHNIFFTNDDWKNNIVRVLLLNPDLPDEVKLWLQFQ